MMAESLENDQEFAEIQIPEKRTNLDYYNEYSKLYMYNFMLTAHAKGLYNEQKKLLEAYHTLSVTSKSKLQQ